MHDFYYFLYLGGLFIHLNIIIQVSQLSSNFFLLLDHNFFNQIILLSLSCEQKKKKKKKFRGATFHIPLTISATLNRLLHCSLWRIFRGSPESNFSIFIGAKMREIAREPACMFFRSNANSMGHCISHSKIWMWHLGNDMCRL